MLINALRNNLIQFVEGLKFAFHSSTTIYKDIKNRKAFFNAIGATICAIFFRLITIIFLLIIGIVGFIVIDKLLHSPYYSTFTIFLFKGFSDSNSILLNILFFVSIFILVLIFVVIFNSLLNVYDYSFLSVLFQNLLCDSGSNLNSNNLHNMSYLSEVFNGFKMTFFNIKENFKAFFQLGLDITLKNFLINFVSFIIIILSVLTIVLFLISLPLVIFVAGFLLTALDATAFIYILNQIKINQFKSKEISIDKSIKITYSKSEFNELFKRVLNGINGSYIGVVVFPSLLLAIFIEILFYFLLLSPSPREVINAVLDNWYHILLIVFSIAIPLIIKVISYALLNIHFKLVYAVYSLSNNKVLDNMT